MGVTWISSVVILGMLASCMDELLARPCRVAAMAFVMVVKLPVDSADTFRGRRTWLVTTAEASGLAVSEIFFFVWLLNYQHHRSKYSSSFKSKTRG